MKSPFSHRPSAVLFLVALQLWLCAGLTLAQQGAPTQEENLDALLLERRADEAFSRDELFAASLLYRQAAEAAKTVEHKARLLLNSSWVDYMFGSLESAKEAMKTVFQVHPDFELEAQLYNDDFVAIYRDTKAQAIAATNAAVANLVRRALQAIEQGDLQAARPLLEQAIALRPTEATALYHLALIDVAEGHRERAIRGLQQVHTLGSGAEEGIFVEPKLHARALNQLGRLYLERDWSPDAVGYLETATRLDPGNAPAWNHLGLAYQRQDRVEDSIAAIQQGRELQPENPAYINNLALAEFLSDRWQDALDLLEETTRQHPDDPQSWCNLGRARHGLGQLESSASAFAKCLSLSRRGPTVQLTGIERREAPLTPGEFLRDLERDALVWTSKVLYEDRQYSQAITSARDGLDAFPANIQLHLFLGLSLAAEGNDEAALRTLEKAKQLGPGRADVANNLGTAYFNLGRFREAQNEFQKALGVRPDFPEAQQNLALVNDQLGTRKGRKGRKGKGGPSARMTAPTITGDAETEAAGHADPLSQPPPPLGLQLSAGTHSETGIPSLRIDFVEEDSLAEAAGLLIGDHILRVDGGNVPEAAELLSRLERASPNSPVTLEGLRESGAGLRVDFDGSPPAQ